MTDTPRRASVLIYQNTDGSITRDICEITEEPSPSDHVNEELILTEYIFPPNTKKADYIWAYLSENENGQHGIVASLIPNLGSAPMVTMSEKVVGLMKEKAKQLQKETGKKIVLAKFKLESITEL